MAKTDVTPRLAQLDIQRRTLEETASKRQSQIDQLQGRIKKLKAKQRRTSQQVDDIKLEQFQLNRYINFGANP